MKQKLLDNIAIRVRGTVVPAAISVRNLSAHLDKHIDMKTRDIVSIIISSCYFHLRHIRQVNKYILDHFTTRLLQLFFVWNCREQLSPPAGTPE